MEDSEGKYTLQKPNHVLCQQHRGGIVNACFITPIKADGSSESITFFS